MSLKNRIENLKKRWMAGDAGEKIFVYRLLDSNGRSCYALAESQEEFQRCPKVENKVDAIIYPVELTVAGFLRHVPIYLRVEESRQNLFTVQIQEKVIL